MSSFEERVWGGESRSVHLYGTDAGLELTVDGFELDGETTIRLSDYAVRRLRLALTRYERAVRRG